MRRQPAVAKMDHHHVESTAFSESCGCSIIVYACSIIASSIGSTSTPSRSRIKPTGADWVNSSILIRPCIGAVVIKLNARDGAKSLNGNGNVAKTRFGRITSPGQTHSEAWILYIILRTDS